MQLCLPCGFTLVDMNGLGHRLAMKASLGVVIGIGDLVAFNTAWILCHDSTTLSLRASESLVIVTLAEYIYNEC